MKYSCPMHPEVESETPGNCPKCGMKLLEKSVIEKQNQDKMNNANSGSKLEEYKPLIIIIGLIALASIVLGLRDAYFGNFSLTTVMSAFMAGFFLVFSGFKLLDIKGFAEGYSTYDLLAKKFYGYGFIYPFIELALGLAYLVGFRPEITNVVTVVVMLFSGLGVGQSILQKKQFQCACLGTIIKVPLTTVTLIEDFGMAAMAGLMLIIR